MTAPNTLEKLLYTPIEAAAALGISRSTLYVLLAQGDLVSVRIGAARRIPATVLGSYVEGLAKSEPSQPGTTLRGAPARR
ncbi:MAG: helix-turn-helix domain-containing protein [Acidimicrobiales bacterium]